MDPFKSLNDIRRSLQCSKTREERKRLFAEYRKIKRQTGIKDVIIENMLIRKEVSQ